MHLMSIRGLKYVFATLSCGLLAVAANAQNEGNHRIVYTPTKDAIVAKAGQLTNHGGPVIVSAKVVFVFWGPSFNNAASPDFAYARTLQADRNQFGTSPEYKVLQEYGVQPSTLGAGPPDWFDTSAPPAKVTDSNVRAEVNRYLAFNAFDASTVYEVVIPRTSYSDDGTGATSCGGPALAYCAYHSSN